jgi:hypothetical protein
VRPEWRRQHRRVGVQIPYQDQPRLEPVVGDHAGAFGPCLHIYRAAKKRACGVQISRRRTSSGESES